MAAPLTVINLTNWSMYAKRFATEGPNQPTACIQKAWMQYQFDALGTTPNPLFVHLWFVRPRTIKLQSVISPVLTTATTATDIDCNLDGSDPLLNLQNYMLLGYRRHVIGATTSISTATTKDRSKYGAMKLKMPKYVKNENATQTWTQVADTEVKFTDQTYLLVYLEVTSSTTPVAVQFSMNATLKVLQAY